MAPCSGNGLCEPAAGLCLCRDGFTGVACDYLDCPSNGASKCSGHGECLSMRALATKHPVVNSYKYGNDLFNLHNTWDADKIFGCHCDEGFSGYDCSEVVCPVGKDPTQMTPPVSETQEIRCTRTSSESTDGWGVYLSFRRQRTARISVTASASTVQQALEALSVVEAGGITVTYSGSQTELCARDNETQTVATVAWTREGGNLPLLQHVDPLHGAGVVVDVTEAVKGTHVMGTCSTKGTCDTRTGLCECYLGWGSSDGMHNVGLKGDCGYKKPITVVA
jgi:hypothetical protein